VWGERIEPRWAHAGGSCSNGRLNNRRCRHESRVSGPPREQATHSLRGHLTVTPVTPVLLVTGPVGVGKSALLHEADQLLVEAQIRHATVELEEIARCWPAPAEPESRQSIIPQQSRRALVQLRSQRRRPAAPGANS